MKHVEFVPSAFEHGFDEQDLFGLMSGKYVKIRSQRGLAGVYELLGRNAGGNYLHVIYRILPGKDTIRVFHMNAMTGRQKRSYRKMAKQ